MRIRTRRVCLQTWQRRPLEGRKTGRGETDCHSCIRRGGSRHHSIMHADCRNDARSLSAIAGKVLSATKRRLLGCACDRSRTAAGPSLPFGCAQRFLTSNGGQPLAQIPPRAIRFPECRARSSSAEMLPERLSDCARPAPACGPASVRQAGYMRRCTTSPFFSLAREV